MMRRRISSIRLRHRLKERPPTQNSRLREVSRSPSASGKLGRKTPFVEGALETSVMIIRVIS
jgi:hypothetical protein